jgi:hypothetical protein
MRLKKGFDRGRLPLSESEYRFVKEIAENRKEKVNGSTYLYYYGSISSKLC